MEHRLDLRLASFLFKYSFPLYKNLYERFKSRQDAEELTFLKQTLKKGDIVLDIGSNIGFYATKISELIGDEGKVICFEPDTINFMHLQNTLKKKKNVCLINKAVSDKSGKIQIYTSHRLNVDHRTYKPEKFDSTYFIDAITIDEYLAEDPHVDFIKMDIQGAEIFALKGMKRILAENKKLKIVTECSPYILQSAGSSANEMLDYMNNAGYRAYLFGENFREINSGNVNTLKSGEFDSYNIVFRR